MKDGTFKATINNEIKECGENLTNIIGYIYFNNNTYPEIGWVVSRKRLYEDYIQKIQKEFTNGKLKWEKK